MSAAQTKKILVVLLMGDGEGDSIIDHGVGKNEESVW